MGRMATVEIEGIKWTKPRGGLGSGPAVGDEPRDEGLRLLGGGGGLVEDAVGVEEPGQRGDVVGGCRMDVQRCAFLHRGS